MALRLDQLKKGKAPQRKSENSTFVKGKTLAPFELEPKQLPSPTGVTAETEKVEAKNAPQASFAVEPLTSPEAQIASLASAIAPPTPDTRNSENEGLKTSDVEADLYPTQIQHNNSDTDGPISDTDNRHISNTKFETQKVHAKSEIDGLKGPISDTNIRHKSDTEQNRQSNTYPTHKNIETSDSGKKKLADTNTTHIQHISDTRSDVRHNSDTNSPALSNTHATQLRHNHDTNPAPFATQNSGFNPTYKSWDDQISVLRGLKRDLGLFLCDMFVENDCAPLYISYDNLALRSGIPKGSIRTTAKRLRDDGIISIRSNGPGRSAQITIEMPFEAMRSFLRIFKNNQRIPTQIRHNPVTASDNLASSSSNLINNINTNTEEVSAEVWKNILIPPVLLDNGFTQTHAKQIFSDKANTFSFEEVQQAFHDFAYDVEHGLIRALKQGVPAVPFFMGILRGKNKRNLYVSAEATQKRNAAIETYHKAQEQAMDMLKQQAMAELQQKCMEQVQKMSKEDRDKLAPPTPVMPSGSAIQTMALVMHLKNKTFPNIE